MSSLKLKTRYVLVVLMFPKFIICINFCRVSVDLAGPSLQQALLKDSMLSKPATSSHYQSNNLWTAQVRMTVHFSEDVIT